MLISFNVIKEYKLGDICHFKTRIDPIKFEMNGDIPFIKLGNTSGFEIDYKNSEKITSSRKEKAKLNDLLLCWSCSVVKSFIVKQTCFYSTAFYKLERKDNVYLNKYMHYLFIKNEKQINKLAVGSVLKKANMNILGNYILNLPDLKTQQEIINIIEPFEKLKESLITKIQELNKIFINFKDENIEQKIHLKNISSIRTGNKNANFASNNGTYRFFTCSLNKIQYCNSFEYNDEVILLAGNGDIGEIQYFNGKFDAYQRTYIIQTNLIGNVYYSLLRNKNFFKNNSKGSVVKFLTLSTIQNIKINLDEDKNDIRYKVIRLIFGYEQILLILNEVIKQLIELYLI